MAFLNVLASLQQQQLNLIVYISVYTVKLLNLTTSRCNCPLLILSMKENRRNNQRENVRVIFKSISTQCQDEIDLDCRSQWWDTQLMSATIAENPTRRCNPCLRNSDRTSIFGTITLYGKLNCQLQLAKREACGKLRVLTFCKALCLNGECKTFWPFFSFGYTVSKYN